MTAALKYLSDRLAPGLSRLKIKVISCLFIKLWLGSFAVNAVSASSPVPTNPHHARARWAVYHGNSYTQASTPERALEAADALRTEFVATGRVNGASPWTLLGEPYPDGSIPIWGATLTHVIKSVLRPDGRLEFVDAYQIDQNIFSVNYNLLVTQGNQIFVSSPPRGILRFVDADPANPDSPIALDGEFQFPSQLPGNSSSLNITYDGWLIAVTDAGGLIAVRPDFSTFHLGQYEIEPGDIANHNVFPIDQTGAIYIATQKAISRVNWTGQSFDQAWQVPYNFRAAGCTDPASIAVDLLRFLRGDRCSGSGTTPTLMGTGDMDKLVITVDGHQPNNVVALWRDDIPADWQGLAGYDRRVAAVVPLPFATAEGAGFNTENSPTVWQYELAVAQYNGIRPGPNPVPGVQKLRWDPGSRQLVLDWATDAVALNNVLTFSQGSGLLYGSGRRNGVYHFWGLDWQTGEVIIEHRLGRAPRYEDGGNQVVPLPDRSLLFGSGRGLVRIRPR